MHDVGHTDGGIGVGGVSGVGGGSPSTSDGCSAGRGTGGREGQKGVARGASETVAKHTSARSWEGGRLVLLVAFGILHLQTPDLWEAWEDLRG